MSRWALSWSATIHQYQGAARDVPLPPAPPGAALRDSGPEDLEVIAALDLAAFGADRGAIPRAIMR
jgi:hypothetical protein